MPKIKKIFKPRRTKVWAITTAALVAVMTTGTILASTTFYPTLKSFLGAERRITASGNSESEYVSDYESKDEAFKNANVLNEKVNEEGYVLLKNEGALPLSKNSKVQVFGKNSVNLVYGGSGSGAGNSQGRKTIFDSLDAAGITYSNELKSFYEDSSKSGDPRVDKIEIEASNVYISTAETPVSSYGNLWNDLAKDSADTALVVFSRTGCEGNDLPRKMTNKDGAAIAGANKEDHYLQLDQNERALLDKVCAQSNLKHVIILLNSPEAMEVGFLDDTGHYAYHDKIDGALWIGAPGNSGIMALGRILNGEVSPSGRLIDTYARDFTKDPSYVNFGNNLLSEKVGKYTMTGDQYLQSASKSYNYYFVEYEEGIYVGYRYYETRGFTQGSSGYHDESVLGTTTTDWDNWYQANVVYPFGYGLSYTDFSWDIKDAGSLKNLTDKEFTVSVEVKNTGDFAGKDVVELYMSAPYHQYGIEKSHKVLVGFAKTPMLYPQNESDKDHPNSAVVEIKVNPYDFASYDYNDANKNNFKGYELEKGDYSLYVSKNAHDDSKKIEMSLENDIRYANDPVTGKPVVNRYDEADDPLDDVSINGEKRKGMSRSDFETTFPTSKKAREDRIVSEDFINRLKSTDSHNPDVTGHSMPLQAESSVDEKSSTKLNNLIGKDYDDKAWDDFMDQLTKEEMIELISNGAFQSGAIKNIGKPATLESDGPVGFVNFMDTTGKYYDTCSYASECVMGATWNSDLIYDVGVSIGNEGFYGNVKGDGTPYSGLYAPGVNIHRSPFGGRNFEYFSEDGFLNGILAASEIAGAKTKGVYMYIKHFAVNDQETHRDSNGLSVWLTEQSMREIYLKPFEIATKTRIINGKEIGKTTGVMSSFNRIGFTWAGGDYRLLTEILREEWGFQGTVISDFNLSTYMNARQMHYAGGDLNLTNMANNHWTPDMNNAEDVYVMRKCSKNIMYTVCNSCALKDEILGYKMPIWQLCLIIIDIAIAVLLAIWGFFVIRYSIKQKD